MKSAERLGLPISEYQGNEVDYVLNIEPYTFVKGRKWTAIWEVDLLLDRAEMLEENWEQADKIFVAISTIPQRLKRFDVELMFQACDPVLHKPNGNEEFDVVFCGSMDVSFYEERKRLYSLIEKNFSFKDFGKNKKIDEYVNCLSKARVQFIRSMKTPIADGELAQRFFECLLLGPVVTNYVPDLERTSLIEGKDYLSYKSDEEMLSKIKFVLDNPGKIDGRAKALLYHSYDNRLKQILHAKNAFEGKY